MLVGAALDVELILLMTAVPFAEEVGTVTTVAVVALALAEIPELMPEVTTVLELVRVRDGNGTTV